MEINELKKLANLNRQRIVEMVYQAGTGHIGGSLSIIDILTVLYANEVDLTAESRDRVILSKGHVTPALYAVLTQAGIIDESEYTTFRQIDSRLQGHPYAIDIPEIDATTGLLGQGFSNAIGNALVKKTFDTDHRVYAICGDGELHEGQIWEALMLSGSLHMDNITFIVDLNGLSSTYPTREVVDVEPLAEKFNAFNLNVVEINGHDFNEILDAIQKAKNCKGKPTIIIAHTVKGKGISYMENVGKWHSSGLTDEEYEMAMTELKQEVSCCE